MLKFVYGKNKEWIKIVSPQSSHRFRHGWDMPLRRGLHQQKKKHFNLHFGVIIMDLLQ